MIPNIIHFVFFCRTPFTLVHYLAIKSAFDVNKPDKVFFICPHQPPSAHFEACKHLLEIVIITPPEYIFGNPISHYAHQADVVRLERLIEYGGIYLDLDTICVKPLTPLLGHDCVMGKEYYQDTNYVQKIIKKTIGNFIDYNPQTQKTFHGLCNAVILAKPQAVFLKYWYESYSSFRSTGHDRFWSEHSVKIAGKLAKKHSNHITVLSDEYFFYPSYDSNGLKDLFVREVPLPNAYIHHLWQRLAWDDYLKDLNINDIKTIDTSYNKIARRFLA
jgi:Glycosyltransferase sugar-binding region containing DXD motif